MGQHGIRQALEASQSTLNTRIDGVAGVSDDAEEALDVRMDAAEATITSQGSTITSHTTDLGTHTTAIAANATAITTNATAITNMKSGVDNFTALRVTQILDTAQEDVVIAISPGHATPVNYWRINGSGAGDPLEMDAIGSDTDISISFVPKGDGVLMEDLTPVALNCGSAQADSVAADTAAMVVDFNLLLAKLRTARVLDA